VYLVCSTEDKGGCEMFAHDPAAGILIQARIPEAHVPRWRQIEARLGPLLHGWLASP
jgi:hypothetical protein